MALVVFDADVLIGFLSASDAHHGDAVKLVRSAIAPGARRMLNAINYSEILIGPMRAGPPAVERVEEMITRLAIEIVPADAALARDAASVRARTGLKVPDAYAVATALQAERNGLAGVAVASFDKAVIAAHRKLRRSAKR